MDITAISQHFNAFKSRMSFLSRGDWMLPWAASIPKRAQGAGASRGKKKPMTNDKQKTIALHFNECINSRDINGLATFMTDDHTFIDKAHHLLQGKEKVVEAWQGFFARFPDYHNSFERVESQNNLVAISGHSTCSEKQLDGPALWTAKLWGEKVVEWRVYDDTPENRKRLGLE